jgi:Tol biopolymer transport system component
MGTKTPVQLTTGDDFESSPMFAVDDSRIVYAREQNQLRHIWIMNADGSGQTHLTTGNVLDDPLSISRDGRYLIFNRGKPSFGMGKAARAFVTRVDKQNDELISIGDIAVFSADSQFVVFSELGKLWRLELDESKDERRQLTGSGTPSDISQDGKWILTTRLPVGTTAALDYEVWAVDIDNNKEVRLGKGHSAIFLGANNERVLFFADQVPYFTTVHGEKPSRVECKLTYKTFPRSTFGGRGAIVASVPTTSSPDFELIFINSVYARCDTIGSIGCSGSWFQPILTVKPK